MIEIKTKNERRVLKLKKKHGRWDKILTRLGKGGWER
jgi:hypothetical protein